MKNKFVSLKTKTESYDGNDFHKPIAVAAEASRFGEGSGSRQSVLTMTMRDIEEVADFFCCTKRSVRGKLHRDDELYAEMQPSKQVIPH